MAHLCFPPLFLCRALNCMLRYWCLAWLSAQMGIHRIAEAEREYAAVLETGMKEDAFDALAEGLPDRLKEHFSYNVAAGGVVMERPSNGRPSSQFVADTLFVALTSMYRSIPQYVEHANTA